MSVLPWQAVVMNGQHLADPFFAPTPQAISATCLKRGHLDKVVDGSNPEAESWFY